MSGSWVSPTPSGADARLRIFCFAHAGGGSAFFRPWREQTPTGIEVVPVVLPGRESRMREQPHRRMTPLVSELVAGLRPHLDRPYAFFGHSLGSVVAYEAARALRRAGDPGPEALLVSGRRAPHMPSRLSPVSGLAEKDFLAEMVRLGGTPAEVAGKPEVIRLFLPFLRADFELNETYRPAPGPLLSCPVHAFCGDRDPLAAPQEVGGWREVTSGNFRLRVFPGDHFYLKDSKEVLEALWSSLAPALSPPG
ncbi:thioesterase [Streptomyces sp. RKND-216]|uniref:thioesterase II family protein n=1 Tax=Streptomyces sp. RKND-216 TaxID=2562581 RepID=UPI00109D90B7|nr:alpha/beta fold hydrolase [Streptomyces sp. RKND-216]THA24091.1 thioesterase [Streptomyces sp. RKND-216]